MSHSVATGLRQKDGSSIALWSLLSLAALVLILWVQSAIPTQKNSSGHNDNASQSESKKSDKDHLLPNSYDLTYTLKVGANPIKVDVPIGYKYQFSNPGKEFYCQAEDRLKETVGGNTVYAEQGDYVRYINLSAKDTDVSVTVYLSKK